MTKGRCLSSRAGVVAGALVMAGCVSRIATIPYPPTWSPVSAVQAGTCPALGGRYVNAGELAADTPADLCGGGSHRYRGEWRCERALSMNIGNVQAGDWVELRQPDADTLVIVPANPAVDPQTLHRSRGDFECGAQGLELRLRASEASVGDDSGRASAGKAAFNGVNTVGSAVAGLGTMGVRTLIRQFNVAGDGDLVMAVSRSEAGAVLLVPLHRRNDTYVRWTRWSPTAADPAPPPVAGAAPAAPERGAPSDQVARFESYDGIFHVTISALDDQTVQAVATTPNGIHFEPVVISPGEHWLQTEQGSVHWMPPRDFTTVYGFVLHAQAGHVYRLAQKTTPCLPPGDVDRALASRLVFQRRVSLLDESRDKPPRRIDIDALCASGTTIQRCSAGDALEAGLTCVQLDPGHPGLVGIDAGAPGTH